jgi:hypothetical protein
MPEFCGMKRLYTLLLMLGWVCVVRGQAPQAFNYQAVVRDAAGNAISNRVITLRLAVVNASAAGSILYQESFDLTTNALGLVSVGVGTGVPVTGSFLLIDWGGAAKFLKTEVDFRDGNGFQVLGASQLLSVPYALFAANSGGGNNSWTVAGSNIHNGNSGNVGIGVGVPAARLHVNDSSVLFSGTNGLLTTTPGLPPVSGTGVRAFWYPDKAAFRVGGVDNGVTFIPDNPDYDFPDGTHSWDRDSIGLFSFASGLNTKAKGFGAAAFGIGSQAIGDGSIASGFDCTATGLGGFALGQWTNAFHGSFAFGSLGLADQLSVIMGRQDTALNSSYAFGSHAVARGLRSYAIGTDAAASGARSYALGTSASASGSGSYAMGTGAFAIGSGSYAIGDNVLARGVASVVMGSNMDDAGRNGVFMLGDGSTHHNDVPITPTFDNEFVAFFQNGYRLFTNTNEDGVATGVQLQTEDNAWSALSDSTKKSHFLVLDGEEVLGKIGGFTKLGSWNYKGQDPARHRHYGPMAQDFHRAFGFDGIGFSGNDTLINSADMSGVLFIAARALVQRTSEMGKTIARLDVVNQQLAEENKRLREQYARDVEALAVRLEKLEGHAVANRKP